jgi:hypothetical protein
MSNSSNPRLRPFQCYKKKRKRSSLYEIDDPEVLDQPFKTPTTEEYKVLLNKESPIYITPPQTPFLPLPSTSPSVSHDR